ncbi:TIGR00730 family Rossman fold protein [Victivallis vadensis]|uniref:LOG family protein n=1 Tax=Victivallis vadensis TaxID=172901 RepID=UPI003AF48C44
MGKIRNIAVYCASLPGTNPAYCNAAAELGKLLTERGIGLVYGGSDCGTMKVLAEAVLANHGNATGIFPEGFRAELLHPGLTRSIMVKDLAERKAKMLELADAAIALPGGFGTFDELFDAYCLYKLGYHRKPCGLLNIAGYYNGLIRFIAHGVAEGLISRDDRNRLLTAGQPGKLLELLEAAAV